MAAPGAGAAFAAGCTGRPVVSMRLASEAVCAAGAPLHPDWNRVNTSSLPTCRYPRPAPVRAAASGRWSTSILFCLSCTRRHRRKRVLLKIFSSTLPAGRWVAKIRCTPRLRPTCATLMSLRINSGCSRLSSANSSTMIKRCGTGVSAPPFLQSGVYWFILLTLHRSKIRCRRRISLSMAAMARRTSAPDRLETAPCTWGSRRRDLPCRRPCSR